MELATTWKDIPDEPPSQILTVGELLENLKDENPDTPAAFLNNGKLTYIIGATEMWVTGEDGALRVCAVF
jgi:hypothetical protein